MPTQDLCEAAGTSAHRHLSPPVIHPASLFAQSAGRRIFVAVIAASVLWLGVFWAIGGN